MSQGTFSDLLIRLETFKRIFVFCPKMDFLPKGKDHGFGSKMTKVDQIFKSAFFTPLCP